MRTVNIITACAAVGSFLMLGVVLLGATSPQPQPIWYAQRYCWRQFPGSDDGQKQVDCVRVVLPIFAAGMADQEGR